jgi:uncharacterized protein (TIGR02391 family)
MKQIKNLIAQANALQGEINQLPGIQKPVVMQKHLLPELEQVVTDPELFKTVNDLFSHGHHAEAVKKAFVFLNNLVKTKAGKGRADGADLMRTSFSVNNPSLLINTMNTQSERDEQQGYMDILAGVMTGIRNPRAHEHDWEDTEERALQLLSLANHLVLRVRGSMKVSENIPKDS